MANIKSAKKRILVTEKKELQNKMVISEMKTAIKKFNAAVEKGDKESAAVLFPAAISIIDSTCAKGSIHKNNANRKKSALAKKYNALNA